MSKPKLKNNEPWPKCTGSYKKKACISSLICIGTFFTGNTEAELISKFKSMLILGIRREQKVF